MVLGDRHHSAPHGTRYRTGIHHADVDRHHRHAVPREQAKSHRIIAVVMGMAGVLVILRPGLEIVTDGALVVLLGVVLRRLQRDDEIADRG